ncbi:MAG: nucleoside hydrolase [Alphaproteobacteria bacterium]|nr:nucleoside hydrolase [Alphaproteobacteria bacterium]
MMRLKLLVAALLALHLGAREAPAATPVWIDTDAACGVRNSADVDDCWALVQALAAPELAVRGVGTVFGNVKLADAQRMTLEVMARARAVGLPDAPVHRGADRPGLEPSAASRALVDALARERLTIIALGPLNNIAAALEQAPWRVGQIERILAVAGQRGGRAAFFPGSSRVMHLHDLNLRTDPEAFAAVLKAGAKVTLLPFELAAAVTIASEDLDRLAGGAPIARWLAETSRDWLSVWRDWFGADGFHPFDSLAVGYAISPGRFQCQPLFAWIETQGGRLLRRAWLLVGDSPTISAGVATVTYCSGIDPGFKSDLLARLVRL